MSLRTVRIQIPGLDRLRRRVELLRGYDWPCYWQKRKLRRSTAPPLEVNQGEVRFESGVYALIVIHQSNAVLDWSLKNLIHTLLELQINPILLCNQHWDSSWLSKAHSILVLNNQGYDFGAWQQGVFRLKDIVQPSDLKRVLFFNDSIYYFRSHLRSWLQKFRDSSSDVLGAFSSFELAFHLQTFAFSVSSTCFFADAFQNFWQNYLPISNRRYCIREGEIGLSQALLAGGMRLNSQFEVVSVLNFLRSLNPNEFSRVFKEFPWLLRKEIPRELESGDAIEALLRTAALRSPVHCFGLVAFLHLGLPILKKDLVYRGLFNLHELQDCLEHRLSPQEWSLIHHDICQKGCGKALEGRPFWDYSLGLS